VEFGDGGICPTQNESSGLVTMKPLSQCRLYAFVDTGYLRGRAPEVLASQLCEGGADLIQVRAKGAASEDICHMAKSILSITRPAGVGLVINDYPSLARELGADYCHLGQEDFFGTGFTHVDQVRPPECELGIGLSTHRPEEAQRAVQAGASYVAIGPVYPTATKPTAKAVTLEYVRWAAANISAPWFAIGGINLQNLDEVLSAGAKRICVVSAILGSDDVAKRCREFRDRLGVT
jgi:thiamine-phosphate pyrophosphorylase